MCKEESNSEKKFSSRLKKQSWEIKDKDGCFTVSFERDAQGNPEVNITKHEPDGHKDDACFKFHGKAALSLKCIFESTNFIFSNRNK